MKAGDIQQKLLKLYSSQLTVPLHLLGRFSKLAFEVCYLPAVQNPELRSQFSPEEKDLPDAPE